MTAPAGSACFQAAPLDRPTRWLTFAVTVLLVVALPLFIVWGEDNPVLLWIAFTVGVGVLALAWGLAPAAYEVAPGELRVVRRLFGRKAFRVTGPAGRVSWRVGIGSFRLLGSGGAFGWYGLFWRPGVGRYRAYITDRARMVGCDTADGLLLVSPADPDALVGALKGCR